VGVIPVEELAPDGVGQDLVNSVRTPGLDGLFGRLADGSPCTARRPDREAVAAMLSILGVVGGQDGSSVRR
jgi:hypothetical protein